MFELPPDLAAHEPPEARGIARDAVRLMVSRRSDDTVAHARFHELPDVLAAGDVLVVNTSATINAAFDAIRRTGSGSDEAIMLHLSTPLSLHRWVVELRREVGDATEPLLDARPGDRIQLPGGALATLIAPYIGNDAARVRLWSADMTLPSGVLDYASWYGSPIRYDYVGKSWPLRYYQSVFATEPGSVEMPSAARPFTGELVRRLQHDGVRIVPIVLHTGVASLEADELPYPERYRVPRATADVVNSARASGARIVAIGTTVVRALETVATPDGRVGPGSGWTDLVITPERGLYATDALLTGLHAPNASHLLMLEALAGREHLAIAYTAAIRHRYLWHEFGDSHLIVP